MKHIWIIEVFSGGKWRRADNNDWFRFKDTALGVISYWRKSSALAGTRYRVVKFVRAGNA